MNAEIILLSEAKERAAQVGQPVDARAGRSAEQQLRAVVDHMVDDLLVLQQAAEMKLSVEEAEIDRAIDEIKRQNNLTQAQLVEALPSQGYTLASYRRELRRQLLRQKVLSVAVRSRINVTDEEARAFYEQNARQAGGQHRAHIRHVLIAVPSGASNDLVEQLRKTAAKVVDEARGGREFAELAKRYSDDERTKNEGGDLGWVKQGEGLPETMEELIFSMDTAKEVRGPVRTDRGFEVVQLLERRADDIRPFEEIKDTLRQQLVAQQLDKQIQLWLGELRKKAHIEIRL